MLNGEPLPHAISSTHWRAIGDDSLWTDLARRAGFARGIKVLGTTAMLGLFAGLHASLPAWIHRDVIWTSTSWLEQVIPLWDLAYIPYLSLWAYVCLVSALCVARRELVATTSACAALALTGLLIISLFPTQVLVGADAANPALRGIQQAVEVGAVRTFPSLHAAFAVLTGLVLDWHLEKVTDSRSLRRLNRWWCMAILLSTVLTHEHSVTDALAGIVLALPSWWAWVCMQPNKAACATKPDAA